MLKVLGGFISGAGMVSLVLACATATADAQVAPAQPTVQQGATNNHVYTGPKHPIAKKNKKGQKKEVVETPPPPPPPPPTPEQMPAQIPEVLYSDGLLTINAQNSTLNDVLAAVRRVTGATIEKPPMGGSDRVAVRLGPGQPKDVLAALLNGSRYDYVIVGPMGHPGGVQRIILTARANMPSQSPLANAPGRPGPPNAQNPAVQTPAPENNSDTEDTTVPEQEQPEQPEIEQPEQPQPQQQQLPPQGYPQATPPEQQPQAQPPQGQEDQGQQPHVKSPEELLRELQQMQKQQQDQQQQNQQQPPQ